MANTCKICKCKDDHPTYIGQEIRLGLGDTFSYFCCNNCGCLQIEDIPQNMQKYYENYYSVEQRNEKAYWLKNFIRRQLFAYRLNGKGNLGKIAAKCSQDYFFNEAFEWIVPEMFNFNSSILDVGAGYGRLLQKMSHSGFSDTHGIDPFIENDLEYKIGKRTLRIEKKDVYELNRQYDVIMLHHVLEHIPDQNTVFEHLVKRMHSQSKLIVVIPMMSEYIWHHLGMNGFQLADVPRHFYIHTQKSLSFLSEKHGLQLISDKYFGNKRILISADNKKQLSELNKRPEDLAATLVAKKDSGLACFYFELKKQ